MSKIFGCKRKKLTRILLKIHGIIVILSSGQCPMRTLSHPLQGFFHGLSVLGGEGAARLRAALPALQVVGGVEGCALRTGVVRPFFRHPLRVPDVADPLKVLPEFGAVRALCLEGFQRVAGVFVAVAAEVDSPFGGAYGHLAGFAVGAPLLRAAAGAAHLLFRKLKPLRQRRQPRRVLLRGDVQRTRLAVQAAHRGERLVRLFEARFLVHDVPP